MFKELISICIICLIGKLEGYFECEGIDKTILNPCRCESYGNFNKNRDIICENTDLVNILDNIFNNLSRYLGDKDKGFNYFSLRNTNVSELKENTFKNITFSGIQMVDCHLTSIHENAFMGTENVIQYFELYRNYALQFQSIFKIICKFKYLKRLSLEDNYITEIPSNAFNSKYFYQDYLTDIRIGGSLIRKIGSNVFSTLRNLTSLTIYNTSIDYLPDYTFEFQDFSNKILYISISYPLNNYIPIFSNYSFVNLRHPTKIFPFINYFEERVFLPFLIENNKNMISLVTVNCSDCRNKWLNRSLFKQIDTLFLNVTYCLDELSLCDKPPNNLGSLNNLFNFYYFIILLFFKL